MTQTYNGGQPQVSEKLRTTEEALKVLAEIGGKFTAEEDIVFSGTKLVIPVGMNLTDAINFLDNKQEEDSRRHTFHKTFNYRPWDGALALYSAFKRTFGMVNFNRGDLITIKTGIDSSTQVPWGEFQVPQLPNASIQVDTDYNEFGPVFSVVVNGRYKDRFIIEGLFAVIEDELEKSSLYRGQAIDGAMSPNFLDLRGFDPNKVVYSESALTQLDANVWSVMRHADKLEALGMPLKRSVLLEGPYGTGKTLAATWTAKVAVENGWTFISCRPDQDDLDTVMQTAQLYEPAVVFFEDVDTIANPESMSQDRVSKLLDMFDGIQAKGTRLIVVLTTNHVDRIHKGMVRPGRLDAVIHIGELDAAGYEKLVKVLVPKDKLADDIDFTVVAESFDGFLPAFAAEAVNRAMRYNVARNAGDMTTLSTADFVEAAEGLRPQLALMNGAKEGKSDRPQIEQAIQGVVEDVVSQTRLTSRGGQYDTASYDFVIPKA